MKKMLALILAATMAFSMVACGGNTNSSATGANANTVTVQIGPNPETMDPALNSALDAGNMILTSFEGLLIIDENNEIQPGQAESWEVSEDGMTWTFHLREGLKWSDGTDLTAEDFVYSYKRVVDPATAAPYSDTVLGMVAGYEEAVNGNVDALQVEAPDAKTFVVHLSYPCSYFDKLAAFSTLNPVQKATVEENGESWATEADTYVSNGPFYMTEWVVGQKIVFTKNPNYVGGWDTSKIKADSITFLLMEDSTAAYTAFQTGQAQLVRDFPTEEIDSIKNTPEYKQAAYLSTSYQSINLEDEVFQDVNVRKALSLAINRDYLANTLMKGLYTPAYSLVCPGVTDEDGSQFVDNAASYTNIPTDYEQAKAEAQAALAEAGYPNGEGFPTITFTTNDAGYNKTVAEYMQQCYKEVLGINMEIEIVEWSSFSAQRRAGDYQLARNGWVLDYDDPSNILELFATGNGNNDGRYSNAAFDAALEASKTADSTVHYSSLHEAEKIIMDDYALIPLVYGTTQWLQSEDLQGVWYSPYGYFYLQYAYTGEAADDTTVSSEAADSTSVAASEAESTSVASSEAAESTAASSEAESTSAASSEVAESASASAAE